MAGQEQQQSSSTNVLRQHACCDPVFWGQPCPQGLAFPSEYVASMCTFAYAVVFLCYGVSGQVITATVTTDVPNMPDLPLTEMRLPTLVFRFQEHAGGGPTPARG